jgi:hypothetical protein
MFNNSKYTNIIDGAKNREREGCVELHHIVPRSIGGSDTKDNLIYLTFREHFLAHWSKTRSGIGNPNYGKPRSEETKRKIKESRLRFEELKRNQNV